MELLEIDALYACYEAVQRQQELLPQLASALRVAPEEVFYRWAFRRCHQRGRLPDSAWVYFFHGLECDLKNTSDGRFLRLDFGPQGRVDTFTAWGVLQFIMTSVPPWPEFAVLKQHLATLHPPDDQFSGNFAKFCEIWESLERKGCFEPADAKLIELLARWTSIGADDIQQVHFPPGTPEKTQIDSSVAHRKHLSEQGQHLLEMHLTSHCSRPGQWSLVV